MTREVPYLGFPMPENRVNLGAPTQPGSGSIDAKSESRGVKGVDNLLGPCIYSFLHPSESFMWL